MGEVVRRDELVANIETDKVTIPVNSPEGGKLTKMFAASGDTVEVGSDLFEIDLDYKQPEASPTVMDEPANIKTLKTVAEDMKFENEKLKDLEPKSQDPQSLEPKSIIIRSVSQNSSRSEKKIPLSRMRIRIADRMKEAQNTAASLTTFNEVDMSALSNLRSLFREEYQEKYGIKLGYMSAFVKACAIVLQDIPVVNSQIDYGNKQIITPDYVDISVAVSTPKVCFDSCIVGAGDSGAKELP